ncbi:MAG: ABC transporter ATP-binding protein [Lachnospiraceae bacterium]|nr:ABC transporter ATP-binding protein [Lachnospiraceae bacterium]
MKTSEKKGVVLEHISKIYIDPKTKKQFYAVKDMNLNIEPGTFVTLLGPSGCGKTTTLRMVAGFESPDEGQIYIGSEAVNELTPNKRDTAMVFQSYALLPHYNVFDNVAYGLKLRKLPKEVIHEKVINILKLVEMEGMESRMTNQLSGGQQQRVALARALVLEPGVLLFDEPLSNLDAKLRVTMRTEIRRIQQKVGITAIYVTHDQSEAMSISDQIIIMSKGRMEQVGSPREIYYHPASKFVADFIGEANFIPAKVESVDDVFGTADIDVFGEKITVRNHISVNEGEEALLVIRPENAKLSDKGILKGVVTLSTFMGSYQYYRLKVGDMEIQLSDYNPVNRKIYEVSEEAYLDFDPKAVYILK